MNKTKKTVCVDLDGVLAKYDGWKGVKHIGKPIEGAQAFVRALRRDYRVVIFTTRTRAAVNAAESGTLESLIKRVRGWLDKHGFEYDEVYAGQGKPLALAYIDDRAIRCVPQQFDEPTLAYERATAMLAYMRGCEDAAAFAAESSKT